MKNKILKILTGLMFSISSIYGADYTLTIDSANVNEGVGIASINIRVTPQNSNTWSEGDTIELKYSTKNSGTINEATANVDYVNIVPPINITIVPDSNGQASIYIPVEIIDDVEQSEPNEDFIIFINEAIEVNNTKSVEVGEGGLITIIENDTDDLPNLKINDIVVSEGDGFATFTVTASRASATDIIFNFQTVDGTALDTTDYIQAGGSLVLPAGSTTKSITISLRDDLITEIEDETFYVYISNPSANAVIYDAKGVGLIKDNDIGVTLSINDAMIGETDINQELNAKIVISEPLTNDLTVVYHTEENKAKKDLDYVNIETNTIVIPAGSTEYNLTVTIIGDTLPEDAEDFYIEIDSITGVNSPFLADAIAKITIFDNDKIEGCSSLVGLMTINEYQNNPHYMDENGEKVLGNYVEIKYIDFLIKQFITNDWTLTIHTNSGTQQLTWDQRDNACVDPRYEVFQFDNEVMGAIGYVVLADANGNEIDILRIDNSDHYTPYCNDFVYDIDFPSSAQNKDIFRDPDGTGDWYDVGSGANSGGSRCENKDGYTGLLFTEFDAIDNDEITPSLVISEKSVPIKTKVSNDKFRMKILSIDLDTALLLNKSVQIKVFFADEFGNKYLTDNPGVLATFSNNAVAFEDFIYPKANRKSRLYFEYCKNTMSGDLSNWDSCYGIGENYITGLQVRSHSRDMFSFRPNILTLTKASEPAFPELLKAGENYKVGIEALDKAGTRTVGYTVITENYSNYLFADETKYFKTGVEDTANELNGVSTVDKTEIVHMVDGYSTVGGVTTAEAEELIGVSYSDVGDIKINIYDSKWAEVDYDDTPADCTSSSHIYVCGEKEMTFIPHHFKIEEFRIRNNDTATFGNDGFTYVANDLVNMSAKIEAKIQAVNKAGEITQNFKYDAADTSHLYYENEVSVIPEIEFRQVTDDNKNGYIYHEANETIIDVKKIKFGENTVHAAGVRTITAEEVDFPINFNFKRDMDLSASPFEVEGSYISLRVDSTYVDSLGHTETVTGKIAGNDVDSAKCLTDDNCVFQDAEDSVIFYYGRAIPSKDFYDNITLDTVNTPILNYVYCDLGITICRDDYNIDLDNGRTDKESWWISTSHTEVDGPTGHGKVVVQTGAITESLGGTIALDTDTAKDFFNGRSNEVNVNLGAGSPKPLTAEIDFKADTDEWLIYNEDDDIIPSPFYKVRFITDTAVWTGVGETGHVVNEVVSEKRTKRMNW